MCRNVTGRQRVPNLPKILRHARVFMVYFSFLMGCRSILTFPGSIVYDISHWGVKMETKQNNEALGLKAKVEKYRMHKK